MYIDGVILFSLLIIVLIIGMMAYLGRYAKRHIAIDEEKARHIEDKDTVYPKEAK